MRNQMVSLVVSLAACVHCGSDDGGGGGQAAGSECRGADRELTVDGLGAAFRGAVFCRFEGGPSCLSELRTETEESRSRLTAACRDLFDAVEEELGPTIGEGPTTCHLGVCCDPTGCVSR